VTFLISYKLLLKLGYFIFLRRIYRHIEAHEVLQCGLQYSQPCSSFPFLTSTRKQSTLTWSCGQRYLNGPTSEPVSRFASAVAVLEQAFPVSRVRLDVPQMHAYADQIHLEALNKAFHQLSSKHALIYKTLAPRQAYLYRIAQRRDTQALLTRQFLRPQVRAQRPRLQL
jgi:hypothetical protein